MAISALRLPRIAPFRALDSAPFPVTENSSTTPATPTAPGTIAVEKKNLTKGDNDIAADPSQSPDTALAHVRFIYDQCVEALVEVRRLENRTAALKASLIIKLAEASSAESTLLELDVWQRTTSETSVKAEIALALAIPEATAAMHVHQSEALGSDFVRTFEQLRSGQISWRHASTVTSECQTLSATQGITDTEVAEFEEKLLTYAVNTTAQGFASKARRLREGTHPKTLATRTREAISRRELSLEPGKDGMSWVGLYLPAVAGAAIWVSCTRHARAMQKDPAEHRTLAQLRVDVAAALLLGQGPEGAARLQEAATPQGAHRAATPQGATLAAEAETDSGTGGLAAKGSRSGTATTIVTQHGTTVATHGPTIDQHGAASSAFAPHQDTPANREDTPANREKSVANREDSAADHAEVAKLTTLQLASGYENGLVDGMEQDPTSEYLNYLEVTRSHQTITEPPLPQAQIVVTVPALSLLNATAQPAELSGYGPIDHSTARKLAAKAGSLLRILTDPSTGEPLDAPADRYRLRASERVLLQAWGDSCSWPNCQIPAILTESEHLRAFELGGKTVRENLQPLCKKHHVLKHFKDDKDKHGTYRRIKHPHRNHLRIRGWTPQRINDDGILWTSPSGRRHPPNKRIPVLPEVPDWVKIRAAKRPEVKRREVKRRPGTIPWKR